ncbi:MAG: response regulator transcription factor, partial [Pseudomonadota bacterium]
MTFKSPYRIGILEDDDDFRSYLTDIIEDDPDLTVVMSAETLAEAKDYKGGIDLCLVDLQLPDGSGVDYLMHLKEMGSATKSLILTILGDRASVLIGFESGANGYLLKDTAPNSITHDIKAVLKGGNPISPQAATHLLSLLRSSQSENVE